MTVEQLREADDDRMQASQERIHAAQMQQPPAMTHTPNRGRPASASRGGTKGGLPGGDWVQLMDSKFKGRMLVPAPPTPNKQQPPASTSSSPTRR